MASRGSAGAAEGVDRRRRIGAAGERIARRHLEARGLHVVEANFRTRHGELDLIAVDARRIVFCEVKTRVGTRPADDLGPFASIGPRKRRQVRQMAREWLAGRGTDAPWRSELRFDAIGVELDAAGRLMRVDHIEGAF
jgi:putative endonuclease